MVADIKSASTNLCGRLVAFTNLHSSPLEESSGARLSNDNYSSTAYGTFFSDATPSFDDDDRPDNIFAAVGNLEVYQALPPILQPDSLTPNTVDNDDERIPQRRIQISPIKICCLLNRTKEPASSTENEELEDLGRGDFFKAVKLSAMGNRVQLQRGVKYLLVNPYQSSLYSYYQKYQKSLDKYETAETSRDRNIRRNSNLNNESKPVNDFRYVYPLEKFELQMVNEEKDRINGRCGLYKMIPIHNPSIDNIRLLKRRKDVFVMFIPHDQMDNAGEETGEQAYRSADTPDPVNSSSDNKKRNIYMKRKCICEVNKSKSMVLKELLSKVLVKHTKNLTKIKYQQEIKHIETPVDSFLSKTNWDFLDLLKSSVKTSPQKENSTWFKLKQMLNKNPTDHLSSLSENTKEIKQDGEGYTKEYLMKEILSVRLNVIRSWRFATILNTWGNHSEVIFPVIRVDELLMSLQTPTPYNYTYLESERDNYLIGDDHESKILKTSETCLSVVKDDILSIKARIRLKKSISELARVRLASQPTVITNIQVDEERLQNTLLHLSADLQLEKSLLKLLETLKISLEVTCKALLAVHNSEEILNMRYSCENK